MRRALSILVATLALTIPQTDALAAPQGRGAASAVFSSGEVSHGGAPALRTAAVGQGRGPQGRGPQRGRGKAKGHYKNRNRNAGVVYVQPRPTIVYPRRAPVHYRAPRYDVRRTYLGRSGVSFSFLYSADWGDVYVDFGNRVPVNAYVVPAPIAAPPPAYLRRPGSIHIPPGHLPPPGFCRIWYPGRPPGHQPGPTDCDTAYWYAPPGSYIVYGG